MTAAAVEPTRTFQPYLPRLVMDWRKNEPDALVQEREGSMVFVDVSGFTKMSERLARHGKVGAEEVTDVVGATFSSLLTEAYAHGGSLLKFGGDALLLFFSGDHHVREATAAAYGMRAELRRIGTFSTSAGKVTLRMSVGVHTGLFHFFLVGGSHRELIVSGPAATETVAMEGAASAGQILLSPALADALPAANRGRREGPGYLLRGSPPPVDRTPIQIVDYGLALDGFLPVALLEAAHAGGSEPEHRNVTVSFIHFGHLDELLEREGSASVAESLDDLVRSVQEAVDRHGVTFLGTDIAPDGGKIILAAGAPNVTGNDEERMLLALREIISQEHRLELHIGVTTGPVFAGEVGTSYRRTYTVMGDTTNLSARLMAKAEPGEIVATPAVLDGSRTIFEARALEPFLVKGKKKPITAFVVGEATGSRTTIAEAGLPLLGRDDEVAALVDAWQAAQRGAGRVVEISAEPGMGKSRLLEELLARVGAARVIRAECRLYQAATAYFPFRALLREAFGLTGLDHDDAVAALGRLVDDGAPSLRPWLSLIATPLDLDIAPSDEVEALEDEFRRARLEEAVSALVAEVAEEPAIVVVEDTHWMDEPSRGLLGRVTSQLRSSPWLVVLTRRPGQDGYDATDREAFDRIELDPLATEQAVGLIHAATEDAPLMPQQVRDLAQRAAGNPLFLIELLDALRRGENVETMPTSVEGLIHARIDRLPTVDRRTLRALSVLGTGFRVEHAAAALGSGADASIATSLRGFGDFLTVDDEGWVQFRHALIRDAAYEGLPYRRRRELHALVGDSILRGAGSRGEEQAELLSVHYWHARRWDEAWRYSRVAGDRARAVYANVEASRFYERALDAAARLETVDDAARIGIATRLGEVREYAGLFEPALEALRRARRFAGADPVALADLHLRRARVLIRMGSLRTAYRQATQGYRLVDGVPDLEAARVRARLGGLASNILLYLGRPREALPLALRAVEQALAADEQTELAHAYVILDDTLIRLGRGDEAVHAAKAVEIYSRLGDLPGVGAVENSIGVRAYAEGRWDDAVAAYTRATDAFGRAGNEPQAAGVAANVGEVLVSQCRLDEAEPLLRDAVRVLRAHGQTAIALFAELQLGRLQLWRGQVDDAISTLSSVHDDAVAASSPADMLEASIYLAHAMTRRGGPRESLEALAAEVARAGELGDYYGAALSLARAEACLYLERLDGAANEVAAGLASAEQHDALFDIAQLLLVRAEIERRTGAPGRTETLQDANRILQRLGMIAAPRF